ncbi:MAG: type I restriction enzyme HsdR N-terminal domain-containing protein [Bosea sp. (in: a-proteobacteria)]|uniref:type I restriction enzyme HsdR N-terminal domain-containing protein n=1 Tax=Bosea sp. (in: a-proteobacteria) TaxID=1871050 RepID=UPI0027325052|nr:type I restriction enzyme HsdR N-terminal domain-containing protein [Bosea sp. (in: a-proteobacteria)]MDP3604090.1 type I restriction enzyme HsdR N-terminal domain-containing protein [Bosea sp. (in: a-proteobacteria)]
MFDFDQMNETDVREAIIRPYLHKLGYGFGTPANIRTEVPLSYTRHFLGRKKPQKDPPIRGRADYVCDATSYGRWIVEVKAPNVPLTDEHAQQAHTYSAHPEIAASHFLLSNGREFRLYATSQLGAPLLAWAFDEIEGKFMNVLNVVGYEAMKNRSRLLQVDPEKPLAAGQPSRVQVVTGEITYGDFWSDHPLFKNFNALKGTVGQVTRGTIGRAPDGRLNGVMFYRSALQHLQPMIEAMGNDRFEFFSSDEYVSTNPESPTIFQNSMTASLPIGVPVSLGIGLPEMPNPVGFSGSVWTEATGFLDGDHFVGIARFSYMYELEAAPGLAAFEPDIAAAVAAKPSAEVHGEAEFDIRVEPMRNPIRIGGSA